MIGSRGEIIMRMDRWFGVLVLGGALVACTDDDADEGAGGGGAGAAGAGDATGSTANAGGSDGGAASDGSGGGDSTTTGAGGGLVCGENDPAAACGCPCCWATDCLNTEPCCGAFCELGNDGAGCCGM